MINDAPRFPNPHEHVYLGSNHDRNERRTWLVIAITTRMMVAEVAAVTIFGSMALVAALAYRYARRNARNRRFTSVPASWAIWRVSPVRSFWR